MKHKDIFERLKKKGGTFHGSLQRGCIVRVNGEKPVQLVKPMPEFVPPKKPDIIYL